MIASTDTARRHANEAERTLKKLADPACINLLLPVLVLKYPPWRATDSAIRILHELKASDEACRYLVGKLKDPHWRIRAAAATVLESFPSFHTAPALETASNDRNVEVVIAAIHSLWVCSLEYSKLEQMVFNICRRAIRHSSHGVRGIAFECLSHMRDVRCDELMSLAAKDRHLQIRQMSAWWLQERKRLKGGA